MAGDYLPILTLCEYGIMLILNGFGMYFFGMILYWNIYCKKSSSLGMNISMQLYVITEFAYSFGCVIFCLYFIILWRPDTNIYNAYLIFATGACVSTLLVTQPLISCFLGFDRCLCLIFPLKNKILWNRIMLIIIFAVVAIYWGLLFGLYIIDAIPSKSETICRSFSCLLTRGSGEVYTIERYITSIGSVIIGGILIKLFQIKSSNNFSMKNTRLVITTVVMAILFDFIPHFISFCFSTFGGINLTKIIGPFSTLVSSINCFVCGYTYYKAMRKSINVKTVTVTTATTNTTGYKASKPKY